MKKNKILVISAIILSLILVCCLVVLLLPNNTNIDEPQKDVTTVLPSDVFVNDTSTHIEHVIVQKINQKEPYRVFMDGTTELEYYSLTELLDKPICGKPHTVSGDLILKPSGEKKELVDLIYSSFEDNNGRDEQTLIKEYFNQLSSFMDTDYSYMYIMPDPTLSSTGNTIQNVKNIDSISDEQLEIIKNGGGLYISYQIKENTFCNAKFQIHENQIFMNLNIHY